MRNPLFPEDFKLDDNYHPTSLNIMIYLDREQMILQKEEMQTKEIWDLGSTVYFTSLNSCSDQSGLTDKLYKIEANFEPYRENVDFKINVN